MLSKCLQIDFKWLTVKVCMFLVVTLVIFTHVYLTYCRVPTAFHFLSEDVLCCVTECLEGNYGKIS